MSHKTRPVQLISVPNFIHVGHREERMNGDLPEKNCASCIPLSWSLNVIEGVTVRSGTNDILLVINYCCLSCTVSVIIGDICQKTQVFSYPTCS